MAEIQSPDTLLNQVNETGQKIAQRIKSTPYLPPPIVLIPPAAQPLLPTPQPSGANNNGE